MVTRSRFLVHGGEKYRSSAGRRAGIRRFARVVSLITGELVTDPTSGFRMTNRRGIELFARDYPHNYPRGRGDPVRRADTALAVEDLAPPWGQSGALQDDRG
jgi:hypothetical protein